MKSHAVTEAGEEGEEDVEDEEDEEDEKDDGENKDEDATADADEPLLFPGPPTPAAAAACIFLMSSCVERAGVASIGCGGIPHVTRPASSTPGSPASMRAAT